MAFSMAGVGKAPVAMVTWIGISDWQEGGNGLVLAREGGGTPHRDPSDLCSSSEEEEVYRSNLAWGG